MNDYSTTVYETVVEYFESNGLPYVYDEKTRIFSLKTEAKHSLYTIMVHKDGFLVSCQLPVEFDSDNKDIMFELLQFINIGNECVIRGQLIFEPDNKLFVFRDFEACHDNVSVYEQLITVLDFTLEIFFIIRQIHC